MITVLGEIEYYLPQQVLSNCELAEANSSWDMAAVEGKAGVTSRHVAASGETAFDLSVAACEKLFASSGISANEIDAILFCTQSPDFIMPSNAHLLHRRLELRDDVAAFDFNLACSGYVYGVGLAHSMIQSALASRVLLVTSDTYSKYINAKDRSARVLFGDGAAVTLLGHSGTGGRVVAAKLCTHGKEFDKFYIPAGGLRTPRSEATKQESTDRNGNVRCAENIHMDGLAVWSFINSAVPAHVTSFLGEQKLTLDDIDLFVFHQASQMTLDSLVKVLGLPPERVYIDFADTGNLVSASIPVALKRALNAKKIRGGSRVLLCGFGVGLSYGSILLEYVVFSNIGGGKMQTDFLLEVFRDAGEAPAVVWGGQICSYRELLSKVDECKLRLDGEISPGAVVGLEGDFSPNSIALFLTLIDRNCIVVPQSNVARAGRERKDAIAQVEAYYYVDAEDQVAFERHGTSADHALYSELRRRKHPGLVLFSSGTSGDPKGAVHDFTFLLEKFQTRRKALATLNFLLFDHWGGLNTMFHTLSNAATVVTVRDRSPEAVCGLIERHKVNLLPATPTFLNLMMLSGAHREHDLSSLQVITYGAEPMPQSTLDRLKGAFPEIKLQQTYGLIELGVMRSKSRDDGSLWVKIGGDGYDTRVVDGILHVKARSTILGYLNADAPITADGWFITGDAVEVDGDYFRILGRKSELINVGGEKVYPAEVESIIQTLDGVLDVTVFAEKNPLIGNIVCAKIRTAPGIDPREFSALVKTHCRERLEKFKVPVKIEIVSEELYGDRFKKVRRQDETAAPKEISGNDLDI